MLETGTMAPDFELPDQNGQMHSLAEYRGRKVVLYFYPKDNTAGCSKQACGFAELYPHFLEKDAVVIGVSKDSVASHKRFEEKYSLPFTLLSADLFSSWRLFSSQLSIELVSSAISSMIYSFFSSMFSIFFRVMFISSSR